MDKKILRWNFVFQYGWVLTNIFNSILLLPLYIKNIDPNTLGMWLATSSILSWMNLVDPGIGEVLQQNIAEFRGKKAYDEIGKAIGSGFIASGFILVISTIFGFACYYSLGAIIDKDLGQYPNLLLALLLSIIATGLSLTSFTLSGINQGMHNSAHVAVSAISANFLFLFINLLFLFTGYGVMSIAIANVCRALYINIFNIASLLRLLKREQLKIVFQGEHFKKFIRIFSFTSASKIISGLAYSVDMIVLARFIPPAMITLYEVNKRPLNLTNTMIGRHSVALMPLISHTKGTGDRSANINLINTQFKFYTYAAMFVAFMFVLNYNDLITVWTGKGHYIGNTISYLLITYSFIGLICYFMSNVGYALGDIKKNSQFNIIRNIIYGVVLFFAARHYGIIGTVVVSLAMAFLADLFFFSYRVYKLGFLQTRMIKNTLILWSVIISLCILLVWGCKALTGYMIPVNMYFGKLLVNSAIFTVFYLLFIFLADKEIRNMAKQVRNRIIFNPAYKKFKMSLFKRKFA